MTLAISAVGLILALICAYRLGYSDGRYHEIAEESFRKLDEAIEELKCLREGK